MSDDNADSKPVEKPNVLDEIAAEVRSICSRGVTSPIQVSMAQLRIEHEVLDLRLKIALLAKQRAAKFYQIFREARWDGDHVCTYNEASAKAKGMIATYDRGIAEAKAYRDFFENQGSILKSFQNSFFRD